MPAGWGNAERWQVGAGETAFEIVLVKLDRPECFRLLAQPDHEDGGGRGEEMQHPAALLDGALADDPAQLVAQLQGLGSTFATVIRPTSRPAR